MYNEGDWVNYRHHEGWIGIGIIIDVRPDGAYFIGKHKNDSNPNQVEQSEVIGHVSHNE